MFAEGVGEILGAELPFLPYLGLLTFSIVVDVGVVIKVVAES